MTLQETMIAYLESKGWYFDWDYVRQMEWTKSLPDSQLLRQEIGWTVPQWGEYWSSDHLEPVGPKPKTRRYECLKDALWSQVLREERPEDFATFFKDEIPERTTNQMTRYALIDRKSADGGSGDGVATVERYLPDNYEVLLDNEHGIVVAGEDSHGWTLDDYVMPRLASGLIAGQEITRNHPALDSLNDASTYRVRRFFRNDEFPAETIKTGLTLAEAREHCDDPNTSSRTATGSAEQALTRERGDWFDGYDEEA